MPYQNVFVRRRLYFCLSMLFLAGIFELIGAQNSWLSMVTGRFSVIIYFFLILYWMRSLRRRLINRKMVRLLYCISSLILFWMFLREGRYLFFVNVPKVTHYFWYLYYIPIILIPLLGFFAISLIGKSEEAKVPAPLQILWVPAVAMILLVLTNNLHQLVFSFDVSSAGKNYLVSAASDHAFGMGYVMIIVWLGSLLLAGILSLYSESAMALNTGVTFVPVGVFGFFLVLCILQGLGLFSMYEMPELYSMTYVLSFEACIQTGLIPTNGEYARFFASAKIPAVLKNPQEEVVYRSGAAEKVEELSEPDWKITETKVEGGSILWAEDLRTLNAANQHLNEIKEQLSESFHLLQAENDLEEHRIRTEEKSRLYDTLSGFMNKYLPELESLIAKADAGENVRENLTNACLLTVYLKRRGNLMLYEGEDKKKGGAELLNCLRETTVFLNLSQISASFQGKEVENLTTDDVILIYDIVMHLLHTISTKIHYLTMFIDANPDNPCLRLMMEGKLESEDFAEFEVMEEDGTYYLNLPLMGGGEPEV